MAADMIDRARRDWSPPPWLAHRLLLADSHAQAAAGDSRIVLEDAPHGEPGTAPEASIAFARCWLAAGSPRAASEALAAAGAVDAAGLPSDVALEACLVDAALRYHTGDHESGRRSLEQALRLAQPEQLRLPFILEKPWLGPVLARDSGLARAFQRLLEPATRTVGGTVPARVTLGPARVGGTAPAQVTPGPIRATPARQAAPVIVERLTEREREVLQRASALLTTTEIATELYVSINTVKSHFRSICRKLGAGGRREAVRRARELQLL